MEKSLNLRDNLYITENGAPSSLENWKSKLIANLANDYFHFSFEPQQLIIVQHIHKYIATFHVSILPTDAENVFQTKHFPWHWLIGS